MGKIITLQKDVREAECRRLEKMVLEGEKTARWLNPPKTITALVYQEIFIISITYNRP